MATRRGNSDLKMLNLSETLRLFVMFYLTCTEVRFAASPHSLMLHSQRLMGLADPNIASIYYGESIKEMCLLSTLPRMRYPITRIHYFFQPIKSKVIYLIDDPEDSNIDQ